ncbi:MAG: aldo/keto reductase [Bacteroidales bacterium]|nr:aldo/keto reductase [Bacteroidales bacterium]
MKLNSNIPLGRTGILVPPVIYGTSYLGNLYRELSYGDKLGLMKTWFECTEKPVVIDTAGKYGAGLALEVIGKGLAELRVDPSDVLISNKLGWYRIPLEKDEPEFEPGAWVNLDHDAELLFGYDEIIRCYDQGNELMGGKYSAETVSVHDPDEYIHGAGDVGERDERYRRILESYRALFDLKKEGKVRAVGIGSKDWKVVRELYNDVQFDWVMFANSFTIFRHPQELIDFIELLHHDGVGIINSALFHGGYLTGGNKFDYQDVDPISRHGKMIYEWRQKFFGICNRYQVDPGVASLNFGISHPAIASVALNTSKPEKMKQNVSALGQEIPGEFWNEMKNEQLINSTYKYLQA